MNALELKVPPLVLVVLVATCMWTVANLAPSLSIGFPGRWVVTVVLLAAGAFICCAGVVAFRRARTTVDPTKPDKTSTLVISGIYRFSRHPMYVGFLLALAAWAAHLSNLLALMGLPVFVAYINRFQIEPEERALRARFGTAYAHYEESVRRWL